MGKVRLIPIFALFILCIGSASSLYVYSTQTTSNTLLINGQQYTINQLFLIGQPRIFDDLQYSGIALDDLVIKTGLACVTCHSYTIIGKDGYQKTVTWENMKNGLLTREGQAIFTDLPKAFRVKDVIKIEVT